MKKRKKIKIDKINQIEIINSIRKQMAPPEKIMRIKKKYDRKRDKKKFERELKREYGSY